MQFNYIKLLYLLIQLLWMYAFFTIFDICIFYLLQLHKSQYKYVCKYTFIPIFNMCIGFYICFKFVQVLIKNIFKGEKNK